MSILIDNCASTINTRNHTLFINETDVMYHTVLGANMESTEGSLLGWRTVDTPNCSDYGSFTETGTIPRQLNFPGLASQGTGFDDIYAYGGQGIIFEHLDNYRMLRLRHPMTVTADYSPILTGDWTGRVWVEFVPGFSTSPQVWLSAAGGVFSSVGSSAALRRGGQILSHPYTEGVTVFPAGNGEFFQMFGFTHDGTWQNLITTTTPNTYAAIYKRHRNTEIIISGLFWSVDGRGFDLHTARDSQLSWQHWWDNVYIGKDAA